MVPNNEMGVDGVVKVEKVFFLLNYAVKAHGRVEV
jgi:hypothetical protein